MSPFCYHACDRAPGSLWSSKIRFANSQGIEKKRYCACVLVRGYSFHPTSVFPLRCTKSRLYLSKFQSKPVLRMRSGQGHFYHPTWICRQPHINTDGVFSLQENLVNLGPLYLLQWTLVHLRDVMKRGSRYGCFYKMNIKLKKNSKFNFFDYPSPSIFLTTPPFSPLSLPMQNSYVLSGMTSSWLALTCQVSNFSLCFNRWVFRSFFTTNFLQRPDYSLL